MSTQKRPNILWYCTDQQRWDTIHALGNQCIRTPTVDTLVEKGVAFTRAYTQCPVCTPSRATFLTGRYPGTHHVYRNGCDYFPKHENENLTTKILADEGYYCGLIGKLHLSRAQNRIEKRPDNDGYQEYYWSQHPYPDWPEGHDYARWLYEEKGVDLKELYGKLTGPYGPGVPAEYHQTTWCSEMAIRFIEKHDTTPWLLSINPFDPHPPFDPPQEYLDRYVAEEIPFPVFQASDIERQKNFTCIDQQSIDAVNPYNFILDNPLYRSNVTHKDMHWMPPDNYDSRLVKACYYAMIELIDDQLGRIIDVLEQTGQLDNTIIVFMSDHGELLGDHGLIYKGSRFFESLVHVPLVISWPERFCQGVKSDALVELVDLAPTLLDAAGVKVPNSMQGKSLYPLLTGKEAPNFHKPYVISEYHDCLALPDATHASMFFNGRYKIVVYHGHKLGELYDLQEDPNEFHDLWDDLGYKDIKLELLLNHFDAMMATVSPGVERTAGY